MEYSLEERRRKFQSMGLNVAAQTVNEGAVRGRPTIDQIKRGALRPIVAAAENKSGSQNFDPLPTKRMPQNGRKNPNVPPKTVVQLTSNNRKSTPEADALLSSVDMMFETGGDNYNPYQEGFQNDEQYGGVQHRPIPYIEPSMNQIVNRVAQRGAEPAAQTPANVGLFNMIQEVSEKTVRKILDEYLGNANISKNQPQTQPKNTYKIINKAEGIIEISGTKYKLTKLKS